ncbi:DUF397 domain-containing protein [Streptomyces piniterrae]|uniref:DUF397 domain-containing protein n=1 Tax=Streptomyces piniterrae TaxID=2571125 RepID=A0A4U0NFK9_9ACTN|nr:DUF397 domain-containing protein [Streptomyces piniterrae]TJZ52911.1 DUF397 domain-containing protein [Streptomyces piniterrae]
MYDWQKSSFSPDGSNCLYLAASASGGVLIRESDDPRQAIAATSSAALAALLRGIRADAFGRCLNRP